MIGAVIRSFGGPEVIHIEDIPSPEVGDDEVLIEVAATSFNPVDVVIRSGLFQSVVPVTFPYTLCSDVAGVVRQVGRGAACIHVGDCVYAYLDRSRNGAAAELVVARASELTAAPETLTLGDAASLPLAASTAWQALFVHGDVQPGHRVLITAAAGGVGTIAVQLAKWKGAVVIAGASGRRFELLRKLGAGELIDYTAGPIVPAMKRRVDRIINLSPVADAAEMSRLLALLEPGGVLVSATRPADNAEAASLGVRAVRMASQRNPDQLAEVAALVDQGVVKPVVSGSLPMARIAEAHRNAGQSYGKTVLVVNAGLAASLPSRTR